MEIQYRPRKPHGLAQPSRILSKREADTEFQYRPHIVDTDIDCRRHFCGRHFRSPLMWGQVGLAIPTCFHASFFPFCPLCWPFSRFCPSKGALFCRAKGRAHSLERGSFRMDLSNFTSYHQHTSPRAPTTTQQTRDATSLFR